MNTRSTSDKLVIAGSIGALLLLVLLCSFAANFISNIGSAFVPLVAGALLLIGNRAGLMELIRTRQPSPTVLNAMIGVALVLVGMGTTIFGGLPLRVIFYVPGMLLLALALPIALSKPAMYANYRTWAGSAMGVFRRARGARPVSSFEQPGPTINIDPTAYQNNSDQQTRR